MAERSTDTGAARETDYKVSDRRLFTAEGELRHDLPEQDDAQRDAPPVSARADRVGGDATFERQPLDEPPGVDFTMLLNAMAEPALLFLGEIAHPATGRPQVDLERARIQIDMLDLLRVKCRGNLSDVEEGLLDRILYQLRMLYVARANQPAS
jgi:hypothetical protein